MKVALVNPSYFDPFSMENVGIVENMARRLSLLSLMYVSSILNLNNRNLKFWVFIAYLSFYMRRNILVHC
ncbi:MAG: hypothetical protein J7K47_06635 [Thermoplasmata archaeon]|nr:hypothetical protein [Thermoplasmata archaeon]